MKLIAFVLSFLLCQVIFSQNRFYNELPKNPQPGKCYVRSLANANESDKWMEVECKYLNYTEIPLELYRSNGMLTENDKRVIKKKLIRLLKNGYSILLNSHFDSKEPDTINIKRSVQIGKIIGNYLLSQNMNADQIHVLGSGNSAPKSACPTGVICAEHIYFNNSRIEFRVINIPPKDYKYIGNGVWCKLKNDTE